MTSPARSVIVYSRVRLTLSTALSIAGAATEAALVGLVLHRQIWRRLPLFFAFCVWVLLIDSAYFALSSLSSINLSPNFFFVVTVIETFFEFGVLIELAASMLSPTGMNWSRNALLALIATVLVTGGTIWSFESGPRLFSNTPFSIYRRMQDTVGALSILFFLVLAVSTKFSTLKLTDRALQVGKGFAFYSLVGTAVAIMTHESNRRLAVCADIAGSLLIPMVYWLFCFAERPPVSQDSEA
jgi:hypothetical protein